MVSGFKFNYSASWYFKSKIMTDCIYLYNLRKWIFVKIISRRYSNNFSKYSIHDIYRRRKLKIYISLVTKKGVLTFPECLTVFSVVVLVFWTTWWLPSSHFNCLTSSICKNVLYPAELFQSCMKFLYSLCAKRLKVSLADRALKFIL